MNVLIASAGIPYPPTDGGRTRVYELLRRLSERHNITLVAFANPQEERWLPSLSSICSRTITVPYRYAGAGNRRRLARGVTWRLSNPAYFNTRPMRDVLMNLVRGGSFDLVQAEHPWMGQHTQRLPLPAIVVATDIVTVAAERFLHNTSRWRRPAWRWAVSVNSRYEKKVYRDHEAVVAVSEHDRTLLIDRFSLRPDRVFVARNGADVTASCPRFETRRHELSFVGSMGYKPNQDAVLWFAGEIMPLIKVTFPHATFKVIGKDPPAAIRHLAERDPSIIVTGEVPDVTAELGGSSVAVVPIRYGAGTRLKLLEAMACRVPVVTTSAGCEGIEVVPGRHVLQADTPRDFAAAVCHLLADDRLAHRLASEGRRFVEAGFDWTEIARGLELIWRRVAAGEGFEDPSDDGVAKVGNASRVP